MIPTQMCSMCHIMFTEFFFFFFFFFFKYKDFFYTILQLFLTRLTFILSALLGQKRIKGIKDDTFFHCTIYLTRLFISIELQKYTTVCNKKDKALIVHLFQKHNLHRIIQMTMTSSKIQMVNIKD